MTQVPGVMEAAHTLEARQPQTAALVNLQQIGLLANPEVLCKFAVLIRVCSTPGQDQLAGQRLCTQLHPCPRVKGEAADGEWALACAEES